MTMYYDDYSPMSGKQTVADDPPFADDVSRPATDLVACVDGKVRTPAEKAAQEQAIWSAITSAATS